MKKFELLKTIALMAAIVAVTVGSSVALNLYTGPKIEENKAAAESGALTAVLPEGKAFEDITAKLTIDAASGVTAVHKETNGAGYVFMASAQGFSKPVNVTVGVTADGKIAGIDVEIGEGDFPVDSMIPTFIGQDSTLSGVVMHSGATVSSTAVKTAVNNGLLVLASNDLMKAAEKTIEQVFEELLPTVYNGFIKGEDLTASGNIAVAYTSKNGNGFACHVTVGEETLLAIYSAGQCLVYKANLVDEATQTYELEDVTEANSNVVTEVKTFATSVPTTYTALESKVKTFYTSATDITEVSVVPFSCLTSALSFVVDGVTYYAYYARPINGYESDAMDIVVVLDSEGKIAKVSAPTYLYGHGYDYIFPDFDANKNQYEAGFNGLTSDTFADQGLVSGATHTSTAVKEAINAVFSAFANKGGNE